MHTYLHSDNIHATLAPIFRKTINKLVALWEGYYVAEIVIFLYVFQKRCCHQLLCYEHGFVGG